MQTGDIITAVIRVVRLHQEERKVQGALFGTYASNYIAKLDTAPDCIMVVDNLAQAKHSDWKNKTEARAAVLSKELYGHRVRCKVIEVASPTSIECEFIEII